MSGSIFRRGAVSVWDVVACAVPLVLVGGMLLTFAISPDFYLTYVLEHTAREGQFVELITHLGAFFAAVILFPCLAYHAFTIWKYRVRPWLFGSASLIFLVALAATFFAGEEMSWGQTLFHWTTPESMKGVSHETNLHNNVHASETVHLLGNLFNIGMFFVLPVLWSMREKFKFPAEWGVGVAEWPVAFCILVGSSLRLIKVVFMMFSTPEARKVSLFYSQYLEEISEQKEMLIAVAMFLYAVYRIAAVVRYRKSLAAPNTVIAS